MAQHAHAKAMPRHQKSPVSIAPRTAIAQFDCGAGRTLNAFASRTNRTFTERSFATPMKTLNMRHSRAGGNPAFLFNWTPACAGVTKVSYSKS
jgi:hypothetical protein